MGVVGGADVPDWDACAARASDSRQLGRTAAHTGIRGIARSPSGRWCHPDTQTFLVTTLWMLVAMVVAVRHALDYRSTARALGVCVLGWALSLAVAAAIGILFATPVS